MRVEVSLADEDDRLFDVTLVISLLELLRTRHVHDIRLTFPQNPAYADCLPWSAASLRLEMDRF